MPSSAPTQSQFCCLLPCILFKHPCSHPSTAPTRSAFKIANDLRLARLSSKLKQSALKPRALTDAEEFKRKQEGYETEEETEEVAEAEDKTKEGEKSEFSSLRRNEASQAGVGKRCSACSFRSARYVAVS